jgi:hypothetical protein
MVFVHGLTGKRSATWTASGAPEPWPKSLLPQKIPQARILAFGYDASVVHFARSAGQNTVRDHGKNLMADLTDLRYEIGFRLEHTLRISGPLKIRAPVDRLTKRSQVFADDTRDSLWAIRPSFMYIQYTWYLQMNHREK